MDDKELQARLEQAGWQLAKIAKAYAEHDGEIGHGMNCILVWNPKRQEKKCTCGAWELEKVLAEVDSTHV